MNQLGALDPELELDVLKVLLELASEKQSLIIVTHNLGICTPRCR